MWDPDPVTEVGRGDHTRHEMPWLLFGGAETGLQGGQLLAHAGVRSGYSESE
jgi:hypothetical protein